MSIIWEGMKLPSRCVLKLLSVEMVYTDPFRYFGVMCDIARWSLRGTILSSIPVFVTIPWFPKKGDFTFSWWDISVGLNTAKPLSE